MVIDKVLLLAVAFFIILMVGFLFFVRQNSRATQEKIRRLSQQHTLIHADDHARKLCIAMHQLYPKMHAGIDYLIKRDAPGEMPYIADWNAAEPKPTQEQLETAFTRVAGRSYVDLRRAEYPGVGDQLDAAYKARRGDPSEQHAQDALITDIKMKYPKPGTC
jgi:hypothetical protein